MTNTEKVLLLVCMVMVMLFSIYDILTLYDAVCWELIAECTVLIVSSIMCYLTIADKILKKA